MNNSKGFSRVYDGNSFANKKIKELTKDKTNDLDKAKAIYSFVRDSFLVTSFQRGRGDGSLKNTFETRQGNQIEINQTMITMMLSAGLNAEAILLSLKPDESLNPFLPDFSTIDYFISQVTINGKVYFLDPSEKYLPFGLLLPNCYNGYSRIMSKKWRETYIDDNLLQDNIIVMATINFDSIKHKINYTIDKKLNDVTAFSYRNKWKSDEKKSD